MAAGRIEAAARRLLDGSKLCAIATVSRNKRAHVNAAYFASSPEFDLCWLSEPSAEHSRNIRANSSTAIAVYDSTQLWGGPDCGIQLFGSTSELAGAAARDAEQLYGVRFPDFRASETSAYRFYRFRPSRLKLFDERTFGAAVFVSATVRRGQISWEQTEIYRPHRG